MKRLLLVLFFTELFATYYPSYGPEDQWTAIGTTSNGFITFQSITLNGIGIDNGIDDGTPIGSCIMENCDILAAIYNGNIIGWTYMPISSGDITMAIQLNDNLTDGTEEYPSVIPGVFNPLLTFNFYDASESLVYYNVFSLSCPSYNTQLQVGNINIVGSANICSSNGFLLGPNEEYCLAGIGCNLSTSEYFDAIGGSNLDCNGIIVSNDCNDDIGGSALIDDCGVCAGGSTGIDPNSNGCAGCTYEQATNYNQYVQFDDGSCEFGDISQVIIYDLTEGNNLISYSGVDNCGTIAALGGEAASQNFQFILGQGQGLFYNEELSQWQGNLINLSIDSGYWLSALNDISSFTWSLDCIETTSLELNIKLPELYNYNQSTQQGFYLIKDININNISAKQGDIVLAYNNDFLVGAAYYNEEITILPVMGKDLSLKTIGFLEQGEMPALRLYKEETNDIINLESDLEPFSNLLVSRVESLNGNTGSIPLEYSLNPAYPNPFNPSTNISYLLPENGEIIISIYDINGRKIETLLQTNQAAGNYTINWNAKDLASGLYFVKLDADEYVKTQKLLLVK